VIVSGTDETLTRVLEGQARDLANIDEREKNARRDYNRLLMEKFPGYTRTVLGYDAGIGEWNHLGGFPGAPCLTNPAVNWGGQVVIPGGETGPGRRSPEIWMGTVVKKPAVVEEEEAGPAGQLTVPAPGPEAAPAPAPAAPAPAAVPAPAAAVPAGGKPTGVRRVEKR
jgi:N-acetylneuraminic acid mutarotase